MYVCNCDDESVGKINVEFKNLVYMLINMLMLLVRIRISHWIYTSILVTIKWKTLRMKT